MITRPDSPSEISAPSSATGSADEPNTSVSLAVLCALAPYATATTASATRPKPIMALVSFFIKDPFGGRRSSMSNVHAQIHLKKPDISDSELAELSELLRIPSISADPQHAADIRA